MRSPDEGISWEPVTPDLNKDVHQVATCPVDDHQVYANTANGVYISPDRGNSWEHRLQGLPRRYGTAIAVHPADPDLMIATVQNGPRGGGAWLCRSENGGTTWTQLNDQLHRIHRSNSDRLYSVYSRWNSVGSDWKDPLHRKRSCHRLESVLDSTRIRYGIPYPNLYRCLVTSLSERVEEGVVVNVLGIDFTFFAVSDMQKSLTFYRDQLGIPLRMFGA